MKRIFASAAVIAVATASVGDTGVIREAKAGFSNGEQLMEEQSVIKCYQKEEDGSRGANGLVSRGEEEDSVFCQALAEIADTEERILFTEAEKKKIEDNPAFGLRSLIGQSLNSQHSQLESDISALQEGLGATKRFVDLKKLVSWMQPYDKRISRYCMYGCWCLPEGAHNFVAGIGKPVDLVDKACMQLFQCYECAREAFNGYISGQEHLCDPNTRSYTRYLYYDQNEPNNYDLRGINCLNSWKPDVNINNRRSNCARAVCECDKWFSYALYKYEAFWSKSRHRIWSRSTSNGLFVVDDECKFCEAGSDCGQDHTDHDQMCCGDFEKGTRFPVRTHGGAMDCCNDGSNGGYEWFGVHYNTYTNCCVDSSVTQYCAQSSASGSQVALDCKNMKADIVFVVDESASVGSSNFAKNLAWIADFINDLDIDEDDEKTRIAFATFSNSYDLHFDFTSDHDSIIKDIQEYEFGQGPSSNLANALTSIKNDLEDGDLSYKPGNDYSTFVVIFTDGTDDVTPTAEADALKALRNNGLTLLTVGMGNNADEAQLTAIASDSCYFKVSGYNALADIKETVGEKICTV